MQADYCSIMIWFVNSRYLDEKQQTRYCPVLLQRVSDHFTRAASARGEEEVSLEIQSSICMLDAMFQTLGRKTPLQDIYTAEEEEMLDQLVLGQLSHEGTPRNDAIPQ
ncbi:TPA: hypothetical protein N0F65_009769 [Lagenidium giganteum]|uniref:Uncharacterized protein n=1 Tax=Lagenidium giganteum TaxID=4803 RepID=A0AAV2YTA2_9STRA|nr:TPA: hypothetical protein N0F65_009769 [Lagenidium giganteum]